MGVITAVIEKGEATSHGVTASTRANDKTIVVFSDDFDKALATFIIANGAAAMGKKVSLFFTFWGLNIIKKHKVSLKLSKKNFFGLGSYFIKLTMRKKNIDSLESLIKKARSSGVEFIACRMSMNMMGIKKADLLDDINYAGVATYLERSEEANMSLFI